MSNIAQLPAVCLQIPFVYYLQLLALPNVCLAITENNSLTTVVPMTHKCTKYTCFGAKSTHLFVIILSATCPVVCCTVLGYVQVGSVVWGVVTRECIGYNFMTYMDYKHTDICCPKKAVKLTHSLTCLVFTCILVCCSPLRMAPLTLPSQIPRPV